MICVSIGVGDCGCFGGGCEGGEMGRTDGVIVGDREWLFAVVLASGTDVEALEIKVDNS
ncbi:MULTISPECIES: hypothetical protein [unclassified Bartonella]|uniref:hypothetical protein n=1 Tax=unclassified Bartonella TaxID=2645622 RepID=UPI0035D0232F